MRKVKTNEIVLFLLLAVLLVYIAFAGSTVWYKGIPLNDFVNSALDSVMHPLDFQTTDILESFLIIAGIIWLLIFASYIVSRGKFMFGKEMGSADWGNIKKINSDLKQKNNVILTKHIEMGLNMALPPKGHGRQMNAIVIGGAGSGKTWRLILPNLLQANCSYVVIDPAGDLLKNTGEFFRKKKYKVKVLNLIDMERSDAFNPWVYCTNQNHFQVMADNFWKSTEEPMAHKGDQFWDDAAKTLLLAIVFYLWEKGDTINFHSISAMLSFAEPEDGVESALDSLFDDLYQENPDSLAAWFYNSFRKGAKQTKQSILQVLNAKMFRTKTEEFEKMTAFDSLNLEDLYADPKQKSILYLVIPTMNTTYNFLVSMLYMQLFEGINNYYPKHGKCKQHLRIIMDEAANVALPKDFEKVPAVCRKYGYSVVLVLQGMSQLKTLFERERWESIMANMDTQIYLGSTEQSCHEYFSKALGKATIDYKTRGYSRGFRGNTNENIQITGRELMTPDEIRNMDNEECLLFVRDERPLKDEKYDVRKHPNFHETADGGAKAYSHIPKREPEKPVEKEKKVLYGQKIIAALQDWATLTPLGDEWRAIE